MCYNEILISITFETKKVISFFDVMLNFIYNDKNFVIDFQFIFDYYDAQRIEKKTFFTIEKKKLKTKKNATKISY